MEQLWTVQPGAWGRGGLGEGRVQGKHKGRDCMRVEVGARVALCERGGAGVRVRARVGPGSE